MDELRESSPIRPKSRALYWTLSLAAHAIALATLLAGPLYWIDGIETHPSNYTQLVATSALQQNAVVTPPVKSVAPGGKMLDGQVFSVL